MLLFPSETSFALSFHSSSRKELKRKANEYIDLKYSERIGEHKKIFQTYLGNWIAGVLRPKHYLYLVQSGKFGKSMKAECSKCSVAPGMSILSNHFFRESLVEKDD